MPIEWKGEGIEEYAIVTDYSKYKDKIGKIVVTIDKKYFRPTEVNILLGDSSKARSKLNWAPEYNFDDIINEMIKQELKC